MSPILMMEFRLRSKAATTYDLRTNCHLHCYRDLLVACGTSSEAKSTMEVDGGEARGGQGIRALGLSIRDTAGINGQSHKKQAL
ncbi:hypothetical protein N7453_002479 [Penicillium expansum]|nr:hypothetical protein N7453_002479 [Penicillium expansum]